MNKKAAELVRKAKDAYVKYRDEAKELREKNASLTAERKQLKGELALERTIMDYVYECNEKGLFPASSNTKIAQAMREASDGNLEKFAKVKDLVGLKLANGSDVTELGRADDQPSFEDMVNDKKERY